MDVAQIVQALCALAPVALMAGVAGLARWRRIPVARLWSLSMGVSCTALVLTGMSLLGLKPGALWPEVALTTLLSQILAVLVQGMGTVIGGFSARYLQGEPGQRRYVAALNAVLASVHLLLMADHWVLLIAAWASVGMALQTLLRFYPDRAFALLAAHKKWLADRVADGMLLAAAALAWLEVGSGSLSVLWAHVGDHGLSLPLQFSALMLVLAVVLRTATLPVHGWLIQVMEAPTPVSALLHAGVVNLGGFVLIRFAPMLELAAPARAVLLVIGLATAVLAGMVMLTRVSIKVRLAWSTVAQMGFMLLECALGLYTLAAVHLVGHSLYKAHAFLSASSVVEQTRSRALHTAMPPGVTSLVLAPLVSLAAVLLMQELAGQAVWPWWWSAMLGLAWAPLLWWPAGAADLPARALQALSGLAMVAGLTGAAMVAHALPFGLRDTPHHGLGQIALTAMAGLYLCQALLQRQPQRLSRWRRWSYAGFYLDEAYTRLVLSAWLARWTPGTARHHATGGPLTPSSR